MNKNNKLKLVLAISAGISILSFVGAGFIGGMRPDNNDVQTYALIWDTLMIIFFIAAGVFMISAITLIIKLIRKDKNTSKIT